MKDNYKNINKFEINTTLILETNSSKFNDKMYIDTEPGNWNLRLTFLKQTMLGIHLYHPEFSSISYTSENFNPYNKLESLAVITSHNKLSKTIHLEHQCENLNISKNGFKINKEKIKIHPAHFHNKVVGLMFII